MDPFPGLPLSDAAEVAISHVERDFYFIILRGGFLLVKHFMGDEAGGYFPQRDDSLFVVFLGQQRFSAKAPRRTARAVPRSS